MDAREFFHAALHTADRVGCKVRTDAYAKPTPCTEWDVRALLNHMVYELLWAPDLLAGKSTEEVGAKYDGDVLGDDPAGAWHAACQSASLSAMAVDPASTVHLSYGDVTARHYLLECGTDILVHGWDLATALGQSYEPDEAIAGYAYDFIKPRQAELGGSGLFAPPVEVPGDAPVWNKLLGVTGRGR